MYVLPFQCWAELKYQQLCSSFTTPFPNTCWLHIIWVNKNLTLTSLHYSSKKSRHGRPRRTADHPGRWRRLRSVACSWTPPCATRSSGGRSVLRSRWHHRCTILLLSKRTQLQMTLCSESKVFLSLQSHHNPPTSKQNLATANGFAGSGTRSLHERAFLRKQEVVLCFIHQVPAKKDQVTLNCFKNYCNVNAGAGYQDVSHRFVFGYLQFDDGTLFQ